jgi:hypothetical protein
MMTNFVVKFLDSLLDLLNDIISIIVLIPLHKNTLDELRNVSG